MSPGCREWHPSVMLFAFIKSIVETLFFSAMTSQLSPFTTVYDVPEHAEVLPSGEVLDAVVSGDVDGGLVASVEDEGP